MGDLYLGSGGESVPRESGAVAWARPGHGSAADRFILLAGRGLSAAVLLVVGGTHLLLWFAGYSAIPRIGVLFLLNAIGGLLLAASVIAVSLRRLPIAATLGSLFLAGTLGALTLALTVGLFGFVDELTMPLVPTTLVLELAGVFVLTATAVVAICLRPSR
ncbi:hypothetical protein ACQPWY_27565 [Pseudonocardia xinjiangensis]|uniref:hypothetical protein n=1 Tax=Pseudonocardia xinjiangensis TaxID=75289 RepID=UPI003D8EB5CC